MPTVAVSLPQELLTAVDDEVRRRSTSTSAFLAAAARRELTRRDPDQLAAAILRSEERFRRAGSVAGTDLVRQDRDTRSRSICWSTQRS